MNIELSPVPRLAIGFSSLFFSVLLLTLFVSLIPDTTSVIAEGRKHYIELLVIQISPSISQGNIDEAQSILDLVVRKTSHINHISLNRADGETVVSTTSVKVNNGSGNDRELTGNILNAAIYQQGELWGSLQIDYASSGEGVHTSKYFMLVGMLAAFLAHSGLLAD